MSQRLSVPFFATPAGLSVHITCVNSYLSALVHDGALKEFMRLFRSLKEPRSHAHPNASTYQIVMTGLVAQDQAQEALHVFEELRSQGNLDAVGLN